MKAEKENQSTVATRITLATACRKVLKRISQVKSAVLAEFRQRVEEHERVLHLALNEAEALALESGFPQLIFPALAAEKAQAVVTWHSRQRSLQRRQGNLRIAA